MKIKIFGFIFLFFIIFTTNIEAKLVDKIVAIVNGEVITLYDLKKEIKKASLSEGININLNNKEMVLSFLNEMINKKIFLQEAERLGVEVSDSEVENQINQIIKSTSLTEEEFNNMLTKQGITMEDLKKDIKDNIKINKLISYMVKSKVIVTDEDISNYIKENAINIKKGETANLVMFSSTQRSLLDKVTLNNNKIDVPQGVQKIDIGEVFIDSLQPQWKKALAGVKAGEFSPVFRIQGKYVKFFVKEKKFKNTFDESLKQKIRQQIYNEKLKQRYNEYLSQLKSKAVIEIRI